MSEAPKQVTSSQPPKKKKREDFHLGKILGEGSYSTVSVNKYNLTCIRH